MTEININDFLLENVGNPDIQEEVKFKRYKSPFVIKALSAEDTTTIRNQATRKVLDHRTHQYTQQLDQNKFESLIVSASVVSPDLQNEKLQKSWGCIGQPEKLLEKMLLMGEYNDLVSKIMEISGINEDTNDLVDTAKN